ncbi:glycosyltransferase 61 family protein [Epilithonimonas sp.]|uniref:glycosyltransferase family 61 protein n=1 Tax=Epilithonimonas sp. TaxID=2894511 RepID=UPI00289FA6A1|nr:glycosyltransferase 61 family protein [Epilithonimonas sp.]
MERKQYTGLDVSRETNYKKINDLDIKFVEIEKAVALPFVYLDSGAIRRAGGILDKKDEYVEESGSRNGYLKYGKAYDYDDSKIQHIDEEVIWFGYFYSHWGHFIIELIGRMWFIIDHYKGQKIFYISQDGDDFGSVFFEFMSYLGVPKENILKIHKPTSFSKIIIPDYAATEYYYSDKYVQMIDKVISNSDYQHCPFPQHENIYLSRKRVKDSKVKDFGEAEIEKKFIENGFVSVSPEKLSLREQISLWNRAKNVACINGTLPLNIIFSREKLNLVVLNKTNILHEALISIHHVFAHPDITYIDVFYERYRSLTKNIGVGPFFLYPSAKLNSFLKDNNYKGFDNSSLDDFKMKIYYPQI